MRSMETVNISEGGLPVPEREISKPVLGSFRWEKAPLEMDERIGRVESGKNNRRVGKLGRFFSCNKD